MHNTIVASRFVEAREELGLTQTELAKLSDISRYTISKIENEILQEISSSTLFSLATALKKPTDFFFREEINFKKTTQPSFRSFKSQSKTENTEAMIKLKRTIEFVDLLYHHINERHLDIPLYEEDTTGEDSLTKNDIEGIAYETREAMGISNNGAIIDLITWLENHGIICCSAPLPDKTSSVNVSVKFGNSNYENAIIVYNIKLNYYRQRFSLAHELGHIILHHYWTEQDFIDNQDSAERQADMFASAFLMPADSFRHSVYKKDLAGALQLKDQWKTSVASICRRMKDVNLISESRYRDLNIEISRKGWKRSEPKDKTTPTESPYYLKEAFNFLFSNNVISPEYVKEYMALPITEIIDYIENEQWFILDTEKAKFSIKSQFQK